MFPLKKSGAILALAMAFSAVSCGVQPAGYSETDGVYYDPSSDTLPTGYAYETGNRVGEDYDYRDSASIVEKSKRNGELRKNRFKSWNKSDSSDWGTFAGTERIYNSDFGFGYPYSYYAGKGMYLGYGFPYSYYGLPSWDYGYGVGFYPFGSYYSPYYGYYAPYTYYYGGYYSSYYNPYYYGYIQPVYVYKRSGRSGGFVGDNTSGRQQPLYHERQAPTRNYGFRDYTNQQDARPRLRQQPMQQYPSQESPRPYYRNDNGGFRSGSNGGFRSGSGGSAPSGGGFRSGGFRN